ncbi:MAG: MBL fold metallo-hydrolase [Acidimicrobiaceae bacterium]|nr:MBL fold metallo-hydrolase [Acidimicrobiaceae bacterium]MYF42347.1 MBL fold metallo-hydrolase [Acidimicrobiaceae bacterium]
MFYIRHGSDNFTIIDCSISDKTRESILDELDRERKGKQVQRFISTHPDQDHIQGLVHLDDHIRILNFYCVKNSTTKETETPDFKRYRQLHDDTKKAFYIFKGCTRRWMNENSNERKHAGIHILWPDTSNQDFKDALKRAAQGESPNNISPIIKYGLNNGVAALWMGDLETDFMKAIEDEVDLPKVDLLFAPHHGRKSGRVPKAWLNDMEPKIIIVGEAPSTDLEYYQGYNTITQNTAGDIVFECEEGEVHIYVSSEGYSVDFLVDKNRPSNDGHYIGTLDV